ncbi:bactofilin family protein [Halobacterium sp. KA-6]|jgi:cytoskeletal protein CcmA (bactofilin family)|uniref:bactofilin family protein n=1 Tax=Halobacterium sp. KA-6 TaxID=2896368 RepID=UPI001E52A3C0|nr:polymer-forming cytoskeletal protein [Halobacterium sp. KA-6]MCD2203140.1 polymer-forming cytoskeletal protein [Halobacterium sp. KA-6]
MRPSTPRRALAVALVAVLAISTFAGVVAADDQAGGTIVVEEGQTVTDGLQATAGTVVVRGTVQGDLEAFAGTVEITESGTVTGNLGGAAGSIRIAGTVEGSVDAAGGSIDITETGVVRGDVKAGAGSFTHAGTVNGSVRVGAGSVTLTSTASVGGDFVYDGEFTQADGATVGGEVRHDPDLGSMQVSVLPNIAGWLVTLYFLALTLFVGALLLVALPGASATVADATANSPLRTLGAGFLTLVGAPFVFVLLLFTIVGIPIAVVGMFLYALVLALSYVWGAYAVGEWILGLANRESRWLALLAGVLAIHVVSYAPFLGGLIEFVVLLFGLGGLTVAGYQHVRRRRADDAESTA